MLGKATIGFEERLKIQRDRIRRGEYIHLALLEAISLDDEHGQRVSEQELRVKGRIIDLLHERVPIAMSYDHQDLLLPAGLPKKLPDIVDPCFPGRDHVSQVTPKVKQLWKDRASGETFIGGRRLVVAQPVRKLILLNDGRSLFPTGPRHAAWPRVICMPDAEGRHMTLLFDPLKGEAFLVGGRFQFSVAIRQVNPGPQVQMAAV